MYRIVGNFQGLKFSDKVKMCLRINCKFRPDTTSWKSREAYVHAHNALAGHTRRLSEPCVCILGEAK